MTDLFNLAARVRLSRRLDNLLRIDDDVEIDTSHITCAEYQLFIDQKLEQKRRDDEELFFEHVQPEYWKTDRFLSGEAKKPITGVRASDAEEFCEWLTQQFHTLGFRYRLPKLNEVQEHPIVDSPVGCWCQNGDRKIVVDITPQHWQHLQEKSSKLFPNTSALDLENILAFGINRALHSAFRDFTLKISEAPESNRTLDWIRTRDFAFKLLILINSQELDFNYALALVLQYGFDRTLARNFNRNFTRVFTLFSLLTRTPVRLYVDRFTRTLALTQDCNLDFSRNRARTLARDFRSFRNYVKTHAQSLDSARREARNRILSPSKAFIFYTIRSFFLAFAVTFIFRFIFILVCTGLGVILKISEIIFKSFELFFTAHSNFSPSSSSPGFSYFSPFAPSLDIGCVFPPNMFLPLFLISFFLVFIDRIRRHTEDRKLAFDNNFNYFFKIDLLESIDKLFSEVFNDDLIIAKNPNNYDFAKIRSYLLLSSVAWQSLANTYDKVLKNQRVLQCIKLTREKCEDLSRDCIRKRDEILILYIFFVLLDERREGTIPTWEGIRIARERINGQL